MPAPSADESTVRPPAVLPIFPLTGSLLLPGNYMPLNIFEPRYRNMVEDALAGELHIGMIQPLRPGPDQLGLGEVAPELYEVGCAGRLEQAERQEDGRFLILLRGVTRFRVDRELEQRRGYRQVAASYEPFAVDVLGESAPSDSGPLLAAVERYGRRRELEFDMDLLASLDGPRLVNALAAALPFAPAEQQALLEAPGAGERGELLLELMRMDETARAVSSSIQPPTVN